MNNRLFNKIHAALLGGAIGDAMGGPLEGRHYVDIEAEHGVVETFLPYTNPPDYHNQFTNLPGTYTDDTRLKHILCQTILDAGDLPLPGDFARQLAQEYYTSELELQRGFLEEYVMAGHYGEDRLIFSGQPTNGAIMMNSPLGLICPADPQSAFSAAFRLAYITDGYAKVSAAIFAAAVAAAMTPQISMNEIMIQSFSAAQNYTRVGPLTQEWQWFDHVFNINQRLVETAVEIALQEGDVLAVRPRFYEKLSVSPLGSEAAQTLAVAFGMFFAGGGDFRSVVIGSVNYGRDNDSYASIAGALAGAYQGLEAIPPEWIETVQNANPQPDINHLAAGLHRVALNRFQHQSRVVQQINALLKPKI